VLSSLKRPEHGTQAVSIASRDSDKPNILRLELLRTMQKQRRSEMLKRPSRVVFKPLKSNIA
jgi:hypothetical protein